MLNAVPAPYFFTFTEVKKYEFKSTIQVSVSISIELELHVCIFLPGTIPEEQLEPRQKASTSGNSIQLLLASMRILIYKDS